jgi:hypothetical protein
VVDATQLHGFCVADWVAQSSCRVVSSPQACPSNAAALQLWLIQQACSACLSCSGSCWLRASRNCQPRTSHGEAAASAAATPVDTNLPSVSARRACCRCACVCVQLKGVAYDDTAIWRRLCEQQFGSVTSPQQWLQAATTAASAGPGTVDGHTSYYRWAGSIATAAAAAV